MGRFLARRDQPSVRLIVHGASRRMVARQGTAVVFLVCATTFALTSASRGFSAGRSPIGSEWPAAIASSSANADTDGDGLTDRFERKWGVTDPLKADTNGDGLLDGAEDPDGDGLSNLGEQRFGTNPSNPDTDRDGIPDGRDDANRDGVADGKQQDDRPVPAHLRPSLAEASSDYQCYVPGSGDNGACTGDPQSDVTVVLYGDSHAGQWAPALNRASAARHWHLFIMAKSGCPSVDVPRSNPACAAWRSASEALLAAHPPSLVVITNYSHYMYQHHKYSSAAWRNGLARTLAAMPPESRILVLGDTPKFARNVPLCLRTHLTNIAACETSRSDAISATHDRVEQSAARAADATFSSMNAWVCPYDPCSAIVGDVLLWRDNHHLTSTYSVQLAPALGALVANALAAP